MRLLQIVGLGLIALSVSTALTAQSSSQKAATAAPVILKPADITPGLFPDRVFYAGKTAPTQMRNTGGVQFADGAYFLAGLVDNSGYSTAVAEKYQAYVLTEVSLEIAGEKLQPGAYGAGFAGGNFIVTDLGGHDLIRVPANRDADIKRPVPLQVTAGPAAGTYRLYHGRDFVGFERAQ
jgi:hypothetical protein